MRSGERYAQLDIAVKFSRIQAKVNPMATGRWGRDWQVGIRTWIERNGEAVLGEGRAELLAAIDAEHSITRAAKVTGMSYRRAWNLVQAVNLAAGESLVEAAVGGASGGGARLTEHGRVALAVYEAIHKSMRESAAGALRNAIQGRPANDDSVVHLAAAISLQEAIGQTLAEFALREPTVRVRTIFGASNELADHLIAGAPGNLFISAEPAELERLRSADVIASSIKVVARNGLAVIGSKTSPKISRIEQLAEARVGAIAVAEPVCPLGHYSKQYLTRARLYEKLLPKVLHVDNSRAVLAAVTSGAAQFGVAFTSDAVGEGAWQIRLRIPASKVSTTYAAALIGRHEPTEATQRLFAFLFSTTAKRCYRRCGLAPGEKVVAAPLRSIKLKLKS